MRKPRILKNNAKYHVVSKINRNESIFDNNEMKSLFMETIKRCKKKYKFSIINFVIMQNHFHFIIHTHEKESLSRIMQWLLAVFAKYYNKLHHFEGHLWKSRFWSKIIDNLDQLFDTDNYINENPVKSGFVQNAAEYQYGGLFYIRKKIFDIIDTPLLKNIGDRA